MNWLLTLIILLLSAFALATARKVRKLRFEIESEKIKNDLVGRKDFFEKLINLIPDPIFVKNQKHQWIFGNDSFSRILGLAPKDYIGKSDYDLFPPHLADIFWKHDDETLLDHRETEKEELLQTAVGTKTILTKKAPITGGEEGTVLVAVIRDITERKKQEETINNLVFLIESSSDLYCICDLDGRPTFLNKQGSSLGLTTAVAHFSDYFSSDFPKVDIQEALAREHRWEGEVPLKNARGGTALPFWVKVFTIFDKDQKPLSLSLVGTNMTERKEAESKMMFTSKMASLGEMAGGIAHEINNPLAIISGRTEQLKKLLKAPTPDFPKMDVTVQKIEETIFRISKIIRGLKSFSREADLEPMLEVSLINLVEETLDLCRERMKTERVRFAIEVDPAQKLTCCSIQIQQVLINLLNNSIDAIKGQTDPWIRITALQIDQQLTLKVVDSGHGIDRAVIDKMMTPFFTTKDVGKGTGLGLSISKGIMESHKGQLSYDDTAANTTFNLTFDR